MHGPTCINISGAMSTTTTLPFEIILYYLEIDFYPKGLVGKSGKCHSYISRALATVKSCLDLILSNTLTTSNSEIVS